MNTATQDLENDHVYILRLIDVMERMVMDCITNVEDIQIVVDLIRNYADGYHHAKEENLFFPLLVQKGLSKETGPVAVMLNEHVQGRNFVQAIALGLERYSDEGDSIFPDIYLNMQGYIDLLRLHIGKENNVLFRMASNILTSGEQTDLLQHFSKVSGSADVPEFISEIEALELIYMG